MIDSDNLIYSCKCGVSFIYDEYRKYLYTRLYPDQILIDKYIDGCVPITLRNRNMHILLYESTSSELTQFSSLDNKDIKLWLKYRTYSDDASVLLPFLYGFPTIFTSMDTYINANSYIDTVIYTY